MTPSADSASGLHADRGLRGECAVFRIATALATLHAVDDAVVHRGAGVPITQHGLALAVTVSLAAGAIAIFPRLTPGWRASLSLVIGILAVVNGAMHVLGIVRTGIAGRDITGVVAVVAGLVLIALAGMTLVIYRRANPRRMVRRWLVRLGAAAAAAIAMFVVVLPVSVGIVQTHGFRAPIAHRPASGYRDVTFRASDGIRLSGWYLPSTNGAAIVIVSSARGDRNGSVGHARMIASHGYGVLLYDARGSGRSQGIPNAYGWDWDKDVVGAVSFLEAQPDVSDHKIGALGLSTGADVLLGVTGQERRIRAVVSDGATARSLADIPPGEGPLATLSYRVLFAAVGFFSGEKPGQPLRKLVATIAPTPLLLIAGDSISQERPANEIYAKAARAPVELWEPPDVQHIGAIRQEAEAYEDRVIGLFDRALLLNPPS